MIARFLFLVAICGMALSQTSSPRWWRFTTKSGSAFTCETASSKDELNNVLTKAGWTSAQGYADVDWTKQRAVVIAPLHYLEREALVFQGIKWDGQHYLVTWDRAGTAKEAAPETIVIEIDPNVLSKALCSGPYAADELPKVGGGGGYGGGGGGGGGGRFSSSSAIGSRSTQSQVGTHGHPGYPGR